MNNQHSDDTVGVSNNVCVCVIGPHGTGKTTLSAELAVQTATWRGYRRDTIQLPISRLLDLTRTERVAGYTQYATYSRCLLKRSKTRGDHDGRCTTTTTQRGTSSSHGGEDPSSHILPEAVLFNLPTSPNFRSTKMLIAGIQMADVALIVLRADLAHVREQCCCCCSPLGEEQEIARETTTTTTTATTDGGGGGQSSSSSSKKFSRGVGSELQNQLLYVLASGIKSIVIALNRFVDPLHSSDDTDRMSTTATVEGDLASPSSGCLSSFNDLVEIVQSFMKKMKITSATHHIEFVPVFSNCAKLPGANTHGKPEHNCMTVVDPEPLTNIIRSPYQTEDEVRQNSPLFAADSAGRAWRAIWSDFCFPQTVNEPGDGGTPKATEEEKKALPIPKLRCLNDVLVDACSVVISQRKERAALVAKKALLASRSSLHRSIGINCPPTGRALVWRGDNIKGVGTVVVVKVVMGSFRVGDSFLVLGGCQSKDFSRQHKPAWRSRGIQTAEYRFPVEQEGSNSSISPQPLGDISGDGISRWVGFMTIRSMERNYEAVEIAREGDLVGFSVMAGHSLRAFKRGMVLVNLRNNSGHKLVPPYSLRQRLNSRSSNTKSSPYLFQWKLERNPLQPRQFLTGPETIWRSRRRNFLQEVAQGCLAFEAEVAVFSDLLRQKTELVAHIGSQQFTCGVRGISSLCGKIKQKTTPPPASTSPVVPTVHSSAKALQREARAPLIKSVNPGERAVIRLEIKGRRDSTAPRSRGRKETYIPPNVLLAVTDRVKDERRKKEDSAEYEEDVLWSMITNVTTQQETSTGPNMSRVIFTKSSFSASSPVNSITTTSATTESNQLSTTVVAIGTIVDTDLDWEFTTEEVFLNIIALRRVFPYELTNLIGQFSSKYVKDAFK